MTSTLILTHDHVRKSRTLVKYVPQTFTCGISIRDPADCIAHVKNDSPIQSTSGPRRHTVDVVLYLHIDTKTQYADTSCNRMVQSSWWIPHFSRRATSGLRPRSCVRTSLLACCTGFGRTSLEDTWSMVGSAMPRVLACSQII
jgi:hypothetical protein